MAWDRKGYMLALDFWTKGYNVAVIEQNEHNPFIPMTRATGIPVLTGNAADAVILRQARLLHAEKLICVCGEDGVNAEIAHDGPGIVAKRDTPHFALFRAHC